MPSSKGSRPQSFQRSDALIRSSFRGLLPPLRARARNDFSVHQMFANSDTTASLERNLYSPSAPSGSLGGFVNATSRAPGVAILLPAIRGDLTADQAMDHIRSQLVQSGLGQKCQP